MSQLLAKVGSGLRLSEMNKRGKMGNPSQLSAKFDLDLRFSEWKKSEKKIKSETTIG